MKCPLVSVIIPCKEIDVYAKECVTHTLELDYPAFEIILLPDREPPNFALASSRLKVVPTGPALPSVKRNIGANMARGEILAFIDSDAFPSVSWLKNAVKYFESADVAAVGGPGITPESDSLMQKASGEILSSLFGGGGLSFRYAVKELRKSDDLPTVNLLVRKSVLEELGGFDSSYWPGEDTYFCLLVTRKLGGKILYAPDVVAFHHRRSLFIPHLKQVASYGLHRGYFAKRFPETSRRIAYFLPSILAVGLPIGLALALLNSIFRTIFLSALTLYVLASFLTGLAAGLRRKSLRIWAAVFLGIIMTHICYGLSFIRGLCSRKLPR